MDTSIGKKIKKQRQELNLTQETFAEKVGLSTCYIGMIERGRRIPKLETFIKIANVLDVSADYLLDDYICISERSGANYWIIDQIDSLPESDRKHIYEVLTLLIKQIEN